jgi:DNA (cytosine-5)-methyltransferase 1
MSGLRIGSLCAGVGGLDIAVERVFGATVAWVAESEAAPSRVLAARWPDVPNLGDITAVDWDRVGEGVMPGEPSAVDIVTAGFP